MLSASPYYLLNKGSALKETFPSQFVELMVGYCKQAHRSLGIKNTRRLRVAADSWLAHQILGPKLRYKGSGKNRDRDIRKNTQ